MNPLGPRNPEAGSCPSAPASLEEPVKGENLLCLELCRCEGALWGRRAMCFRVCVFGFGVLVFNLGVLLVGP